MICTVFPHWTKWYDILYVSQALPYWRIAICNQSSLPYAISLGISGCRQASYQLVSRPQKVLGTVEQRAEWQDSAQVPLRQLDRSRLWILLQDDCWGWWNLSCSLSFHFWVRVLRPCQESNCGLVTRICWLFGSKRFRHSCHSLPFPQEWVHNHKRCQCPTSARSLQPQ